MPLDVMGAIAVIVLWLTYIALTVYKEEKRDNRAYDKEQVRQAGYREGVKDERQRITKILTRGKTNGPLALMVMKALSTDDDKFLLPRRSDDD